MLSTDRIHSARRVLSWTGMGVELPDDLTQALDLFDVIQYTEVEYGYRVDIESVTAANVEDKIAELAEHLVKVESEQNKTSPMVRAKVRILDQAAHRVLTLAGPAVPSVIEQITPTFDLHAQAYIEAATKLPGRLDNSSLLGAGSVVLAAFTEAQSAAAELKRVADWVRGTSVLPGVGGRADSQLTILRPRTATELHKLDDAHERSGYHATDAERAVDYVLLVAAREGIKFGINTPAEANSIRKSLT